MERHFMNLTSGGIDYFGPVPAGHKWELGTVTYASDSTMAVTFYLGIVDLGSNLRFLDQFLLPAGTFGLHVDYNMVPIYAGEFFFLLNTATAGHAVASTLGYIDVDF